MDRDPQFIREQNYFRLSAVVVELGTDVIRKQILANLPSGETLQSILEKKRPIFENLHKSKIMTTKQMEILYPPEENVDVMNIDITLWLVLLSKVVSKSRVGHRDWYNAILCIKDTRNTLYHLTKREVEQDVFETQWKALTGAISRLDTERRSFDAYRDNEFDRERMHRLQQLISEQVLQEINAELRNHLDGRRHYVKVTVVFLVVVAALVALVAVALALAFRDSTTCERYRYYQELPDGVITFIPRKGWRAATPWGPMNILKKPATYAIYSHTAETGQCRATQECCLKVKDIQYAHMHTFRFWSDIAYHYLIDSEGIVYEGRSLENTPAIAKHWNNHTVGIALIGNFQFDTEITGAMSGGFVLLLQYLVDRQVLEKNYTLYGLCEVRPTDSPGKHLYHAVDKVAKEWPQIGEHLKHRPDNMCFFNWSQSVVDGTVGDETGSCELPHVYGL